ncbi:MAG: hypothetical protein ACTSRW_08140 [Candidatus Helarchaeota archaeon]
MRRFEEEGDMIEWIMGEYIVSVNSKWRSNDFPSSSLTKTLMKILKKGPTQFPIMHKMVKHVLKKWEEKGICTYLTTTKYARCRKTKVIYRFDEKGFKKIKELIMEKNIEMIKQDDQQVLQDLMIGKKRETMKSRETMINDFFIKLEDEILEIASDSDVELGEDEED